MIEYSLTDDMLRAFRAAQLLHQHAPNLRALNGDGDVGEVLVNIVWLAGQEKK
jgi:hypothetical protein